MCCSQDADRVRPSVATGRRDAQRMERFSCQSYLAFKPSLEDRTLAITLRHSYHALYMDRKLSPERSASRTKELTIDATFGTNNMAMTLFAFLAEVDGTGVPLAYCFMDTFKDNSHAVCRAEPGATTAIVDQCLRPLQDYRFDLTFMGPTKTCLRLRQYARYGQMCWK
ncbi:hypothetical protein V1522DRAFT_248681 [Lipomyces starkeyi]